MIQHKSREAKERNYRRVGEEKVKMIHEGGKSMKVLRVVQHNFLYRHVGYFDINPHR